MNRSVASSATPGAGRSTIASRSHAWPQRTHANARGTGRPCGSLPKYCCRHDGQQNSTALGRNSNSLGRNARPHSGHVRPGWLNSEYPQPLQRSDQSSGAPAWMRRRNSASSRFDAGPMQPAPIVRSPIALTPMISAAVPVRNTSSAA